MDKKIIVLFCYYNRREKTVNMYKSLKKQFKNIEFLAIDDLSTDGTTNYLKSRKHVTILQTKGNYYYTRSMRMGMKYLKDNNLKYDYLLLVNDDVLFNDNILEEMIKQSIIKNSIIVGATCDESGNTSYGGAIFNLPYSSDYYVKGSNFKEKLDSFNGNCVLIPYDFFINTDIMDRHYSHNAGDFDYGLALKKNGYSIYMFDKYVGICNGNTTDNTYLDKKLSLFKRFILKRKPKGLPFREFFYYNFKNFGLKMAIKMNLRVYKNMIKKI